MEVTENSMEYYTLGIWYIKPNMDKKFIETWSVFADWTVKNYPGSGQPHLLRDEKDPRRFISFGPWNSLSTIQIWRESEEFKNVTLMIMELCDDFQPNTLKVVI